MHVDWKIIVTVLHICSSFDGRHYFRIPERCQNKDKYQTTSTESWTCLLENWDKMSCWFDVEKTFGHEIDFETLKLVDVSYDIDGISYDSRNISINNGCLRMIDLTDFFGNSSFNFTLNHPQTGKRETISKQFDSKQYVQPAMIQALQYNRTTTTIELYYSIPESTFEREIRIRYRSEYDRSNPNGWQEHNEIWKYVPFYPPNIYFASFKYHSTLTNLTAFTHYEIKIDLISSENGIRKGFWSEDYSINITTLDDVPVAVPIVLPGYFALINDSYIQIFWKPITPVKRCGNITQYRASVSYGVMKDIINISPDSISYVLKINPYRENTIELTQRTRLGYPHKQDAYLLVFPADRRPKIPKLFTVEAIRTDLVVIAWEINVSDAQVQNGVTVVWCGGSLPGLCFEPIQSKTVSRSLINDENAVNITLERGYFLNFIFGISVETETKDGVVISSGIYWYKDCIYKRNGMPVVGPNVNVTVVEKSDVLIKWEPYTCKQSVGIILHYIVLYCKATDNICTGEVIETTVPQDVFSYLIRNLTIGQTYTVKIGTKLKHGGINGPWSKSINVRIPMLQPSGKLPLLIGSITGGVVALLIISFIVTCFCRRCLRLANNDADRINLPAIKIPLQENQEHQHVNQGSGSILKSDPNCNDSGLGGSRCSQTNSTKELPIAVTNTTDISDGSVDSKSRQKEAVVMGIKDDLALGSEDSCALNSGGYREVDLHSSDDDYDDDVSSAEFVPLINNSGMFSEINTDSSGAGSFMNKSIEDRAKSAQERTSLVELEFGTENESESMIDSYCPGVVNSSSEEEEEINV